VGHLGWRGLLEICLRRCSESQGATNAAAAEDITENRRYNRGGGDGKYTVQVGHSVATARFSLLNSKRHRYLVCSRDSITSQLFSAGDLFCRNWAHFFNVQARYQPNSGGADGLQHLETFAEFLRAFLLSTGLS
jgi:hypothetical protein